METPENTKMSSSRLLLFSIGFIFIVIVNVVGCIKNKGKLNFEEKYLAAKQISITVTDSTLLASISVIAEAKLLSFERASTDYLLKVYQDNELYYAEFGHTDYSVAGGGYVFVIDKTTMKVLMTLVGQ